MKKLILAGVLSVMALGLAACEKEGPMERAGEKMDNAVEDVKEGVEETGEKIDENVNTPGDSGGVTVEEASPPAPEPEPQG